MSADRFPEEASGPFPGPPRTFTDAEDREIELVAYDGSDAEREALVSMYVDFDPAQRAQGVPPVGEAAVREWLATLLDESAEADDRERGHNVLARHDDRAVGHATLVSDGEGGWELAIFVHQEYQSAGIGTELIQALLGHGAANGVERVWLTVERWNHAARHLYEKVGFEGIGEDSFELEMAVRLP